MRQQQRAVRRIAGPEEEGLLSEVTAASLYLAPLRASRNCKILEGEMRLFVAESSELPRLLVT